MEKNAYVFNEQDVEDSILQAILKSLEKRSTYGGYQRLYVDEEESYQLYIKTNAYSEEELVIQDFLRKKGYTSEHIILFDNR